MDQKEPYQLTWKLTDEYFEMNDETYIRTTTYNHPDAQWYVRKDGINIVVPSNPIEEIYMEYMK